MVEFIQSLLQRLSRKKGGAGLAVLLGQSIVVAGQTALMESIKADGQVVAIVGIVVVASESLLVGKVRFVPSFLLCQLVAQRKVQGAGAGVMGNMASELSFGLAGGEPLCIFVCLAGECFGMRRCLCQGAKPPRRALSAIAQESVKSGERKHCIDVRWVLGQYVA